MFYLFYIILGFIIYYVMVISVNTVVSCDAANFLPNDIQFQDPATPIMEGIIDLHHYICFFLIVTLIFVSWMLLVIIWRFSFFPNLHFYINYLKTEGLKSTSNVLSKSQTWVSIASCFLNKKYTYNGGIGFLKNIFSNNELFDLWNFSKFSKFKPSYAKPYALINQGYKINHGTTIEIIWTIIPSLILIVIAVPSFVLLYSMDEVVIDNVSLTMKVIGHQWYWSYQVSDLRENVYANDVMNYSLSFDSYMVPEEDLEIGELRLLEVDNALKVPVKTHIRILVSSSDVLHSWAVPSLGVKVDAVPGRLNQTSMFIKREGLYYGQCSEICGVNHAFMPIKIQTIPKWWSNILYSV